MKPVPRKLLTTAEVGSILGYSLEYVARIADSGKLDTYAVCGTNNMRLFTSTAVAQYQRYHQTDPVLCDVGGCLLPIVSRQGRHNYLCVEHKAAARADRLAGVS